MGNMVIFKTRAAAEHFLMEDPFILEGLVKSFVIRIAMIPCSLDDNFKSEKIL